MRIRAIALLVLGLTILVVPPARAADEPYDFYAIVSLTGSAAFIGHAAEVTFTGFERWVNRTGGINGRPLHFVIEDDQSNPEIAVQLANQLVAKRVPGFIGPNFGATCVAVLPVVSAGPVMYCLANVIHPPSGSYAFAENVSTKDLTAAGFRYLQAEGVRKIALLTSNDASGQDGESVALEDLKLPEFQNLRLVADEHFTSSDLTVSAQLARIKASGAEAIDAWTTGTPFGTVLHGVAESAWDGVVMTNGGNINKAQMAQYAQFMPTNVIFTGSAYMNSRDVPPRVQAQRATFIAAMRDVGDPSPDNTSVAAWDPLLIMISGLREIGPRATAIQLRDYILKLHDFVGIGGLYDFRRGDQHGVDPRGTPVVRWDKASGEFVTISKPGGLPF